MWPPPLNEEEPTSDDSLKSSSSCLTSPPPPGRQIDLKILRLDSAAYSLANLVALRRSLWSSSAYLRCSIGRLGSKRPSKSKRGARPRVTSARQAPAGGRMIGNSYPRPGTEAGNINVPATKDAICLYSWQCVAFASFSHALAASNRWHVLQQRRIIQLRLSGPHQ